MSDNNTDSIDAVVSGPVEPDADLRRASHIPTDAPPEAVPPLVPPRPPLPGADPASGEERESTTSETDVTSAARRRLSPLAIGMIAAGVLAVAGWIAFGVTVAGLGTANDEVAATAEQLESVETDLTDTEFLLLNVTAERDDYADAAADVTARESDVAAKEAELETREAEVKAAEDYVKATTLEDGYTYTVGLTMKAGTYRANATSNGCYWVVTRSGTNYDDIVDNDFGSKGAITVTVKKGQDFSSQDCGDWKKVG